MALIKKGSPGETFETNVVDNVTKSVTMPTEATDNRDTKTKQIQAQGCIQAACQASVLQMFCTSYGEWYSMVEQTADAMLKYIQERSK